jgi:hypothetical protein
MRSYLNIFGLILLISFIVTGCNKKVENNPPVITSVTLSPKIVTPDSITMVKVKATDNDGDLIVYSYYPSAGAIFGTGANVIWHAPDSVGIYTLIVKASDGSGDSGIDSINLIVSEIPTPTQLEVTAAFAVGMEGDLSNSRISLFSSLADRIARFPQKTMLTGPGSFSILSFTMDSVPPGNYFIDVWKDNDNSSSFSNGDFLGWYGSGNLLNQQLDMVTILPGKKTEVIIQMYIY